MKNVVQMNDYRHSQNVANALEQLSALDLDALLFIAIPKDGDGQFIGTVANDTVEVNKLIKLLDIHKSAILAEHEQRTA